MARGDLTQKVVGVKVSGEILDLVNTINNMIDQLAIFAAEVTRVAREVGTEGKLGVQAEVENIEGTWQEITCVYDQSSCCFTNQDQVQRQHHGVEPYLTSTSFRSDLRCGNRRRFHPLHHGRGVGRDGQSEDKDQSDGLQPPRIDREEY